MMHSSSKSPPLPPRPASHTGAEAAASASAFAPPSYLQLQQPGPHVALLDGAEGVQEGLDLSIRGGRPLAASHGPLGRGRLKEKEKESLYIRR